MSCLSEEIDLKNGTAQAGSRYSVALGCVRRGLIISNTPLVYVLRTHPKLDGARFCVSEGVIRSPAHRVNQVQWSSVSPASGGPFFCFMFSHKERTPLPIRVDGSRRFSRRTFRCFRHTSRLGSLSGRFDLRANLFGEGHGGASSLGPLIDLVTS